MDLVTGGFQRSYRVHLSLRDMTAQPDCRLVVVIHRAFDTAKGIEKFSGFSQLADQENFIILYPESIGIFGYSAALECWVLLWKSSQ